MSERPARRYGAATGDPEVGEVVVRAGCGRTRGVAQVDVARAGAPGVWAYVELAFAECPTCPHRVEPEGAASFCVWRPVDAPHPFAGLAGWDGLT